MSSPFDFREIMKAQMRYGEDRSVEDVIAMQEARTAEGASGVSKTPPAPGRAATQSELDVVRQMLAQGNSTNPAPVE